MLETLLNEAWASLQGQWSMISSAPIPFMFSVALATALCSYVIYRYLDAKNRDQKEMLQATIDYQKQKLTDLRIPDGSKKDLSPVSLKPDLRLRILEGHVFYPDNKRLYGDRMGIHIEAVIWNLGLESITTEWKLCVTLPNGVKKRALLMKPNGKIRFGNPSNYTELKEIDYLPERTSIYPVGSSPTKGFLLFDVDLTKDEILQKDTVLEVIVSDLYQNTASARGPIAAMFKYSLQILQSYPLQLQRSNNPDQERSGKRAAL